MGRKKQDVTPPDEDAPTFILWLQDWRWPFRAFSGQTPPTERKYYPTKEQALLAKARLRRKHQDSATFLMCVTSEVLPRPGRKGKDAEWRRT